MSKSIPKMPIMITSAIRYLCQNQGSTSKEIMDYIMTQYNLEHSVQRQMRAALKRGVNYNILNKKCGHYKLNSMAECDLGRDRVEKPGKRRGTKWRVSEKKKKKKKKKEKKGQRSQGWKGKSRDTTRSRTGTCGGRCRCIATRGKNAYALKGDIPVERQGQLQKDVVCRFENKWKDKCDDVTESTDPSRSTLGSNPENTDQDKS